jgi:hypothetical protein
LIGNRGIAARQLFHDHGIGKHIEPSATLSNRHRDAEQSELRHFFVDVSRKILVAIKPLRSGPDDAICEFSRRFADVRVILRCKLG